MWRLVAGAVAGLALAREQLFNLTMPWVAGSESSASKDAVTATVRDAGAGLALDIGVRIMSGEGVVTFPFRRPSLIAGEDRATSLESPVAGQIVGCG